MIRNQRARLSPVLSAVNAAGVVVAALYAAAGMRTALRTTGPVARSEPTYWATASTMRAAFLAAPLTLGLLRGTAPPGLLISAGLMQLGDAMIGVQRRNPMMMALPSLMGAIHLTTATLIWRRTPR